MKKGELLGTQRIALWMISQSQGLDAGSRTLQIGGKQHVIHSATIVALVGRGLLYGADGVILCTEQGLALARTL